VSREVSVAFRVARPIGVLPDDLPAQLVSYPKAFDGSEPRDPCRPEFVLRGARSSPISRDVALNLSRDHPIYCTPVTARGAGCMGQHH
jgi:hypothetical protein